MFTWICPKCGKEVPPHEKECPYCHGTGNVETTAPGPRPAVPPPPPPPPVVSQQPPPPQQPYAAPPPPPYAAPPPPQQPPPPYAAPRPAQQPYAAPPPAGEQQQYYVIGENQRSVPGWLVTLLVAVAVVGIGYVVYSYVLRSGANKSVAASQQSPFENVPVASGAPANTNAAVARHLEITGFRISEDASKRAVIQFLVVNHSAADLGEVAGKIRLRTTKSAPSDPPIAEFAFKASGLGPYKSVEIKTTVRTRLRAYELPDWQFLKADLQITSPAQ